MPLKNHFFYDEQKCEFVPVAYNKSEHFIFTACLWIINGVVLAGIGIVLLSTYVGTPAELALKAENQTLLQQLQTTRLSIIDLETRMSEIIEMDNEMYRSVLGLEPIPESERQTGVGGTDLYSEFDLYTEETSEILRWTASKIDLLERRINIQQLSFEEIKEYYNHNKERMRHLPAIRPVSGILLSGYGMRNHPVHQYRRMHDGVDFRADIGTEVFATGDATVRFAGRLGTYGLLIRLDHGQGYETRYAHLSGFAEGIRVGTRVKRGDLIGYTGDTGVTQGPHLHYEIRINGRSVDPLNYLFADTTPEEYQMYREIANTNMNSMD